MDFVVFLLRLLFSFRLNWENISNTRDSGSFRQKYSAVLRISNSVPSVWKSRWSTVSRVWYITQLALIVEAIKNEKTLFGELFALTIIALLWYNFLLYRFIQNTHGVCIFFAQYTYKSAINQTSLVHSFPSSSPHIQANNNGSSKGKVDLVDNSLDYFTCTVHLFASVCSFSVLQRMKTKKIQKSESSKE